MIRTSLSATALITSIGSGASFSSLALSKPPKATRYGTISAPGASPWIPPSFPVPAINSAMVVPWPS